MRLFFHKISLIISSILSVLILSCSTTSTTPVVDNVDNSIINDNINIEEKTDTKKETIESDQKELQEETKTEKQEIVEEKKENNTSTTSNNSNTSNTSKETNVNTKQESNSTSSASNSVEVHEDIPKQENKVVNQYIGVPSPNDFYYSYHLGHIDRNYHNLDDCYVKASEVALLDTIDINNTTCYEVLDGQGTILGIYMRVNCNSGNCSKYKEMVGIITD